MRLIDADALKASIEEKDRYNLGGENRIIVCGMLDDAPTVDAEPVRHGRWIFKEMDELVPTGELGVAEGHHIHLSSGATFKPNEKGIIVLKEHKRVKKPYCSECGDHGDDEYDATPYCPNCGAKMDGGAENETD